MVGLYTDYYVNEVYLLRDAIEGLAGYCFGSTWREAAQELLYGYTLTSIPELYFHENGRAVPASVLVGGRRSAPKDPSLLSRAPVPPFLVDIMLVPGCRMGL
jgi:hypothetical protein